MADLKNAPQNASERIICASCGKELPLKRFWQRFCSPQCRREAWRLGHPTIPAGELQKLIDEAMQRRKS